MEILQSRTPAVVVPFAGGAEVEQSLRARLLAEKHCLELVEESGLDPSTLAQAINRAAARPPMIGPAVDLDGARRSAVLVAQWISLRACGDPQWPPANGPGSLGAPKPGADQ
jgi:predicted glycosyltransferase